MEGFGIEKLSLVLVIVLVLFGARRIPEIGASIGKGIREFKRGMSDAHDEADMGSSNANADSTGSAPGSAPVATDAGPRRLLGR
jgi:sec-independent protein translocase protein TatA